MSDRDRNEPCHCGSGKKRKRCHAGGAPVEPTHLSLCPSHEPLLAADERALELRRTRAGMLAARRQRPAG